MRLIVVLGCNESIMSGRVSVACANYKKGDKILATGTPREAVYMKSNLVEYGISAEDVLVDIKSKTTMDNIFINMDYINSFGTVLLVTSQSHMPRSEMLLGLVYKGKVETAHSQDCTVESVHDGYYEEAKARLIEIKRGK